MPIIVGTDVVASLNLTWLYKVKTVEQIVKAHLVTLQETSAEIARRLQSF